RPAMRAELRITSWAFGKGLLGRSHLCEFSLPTRRLHLELVGEGGSRSSHLKKTTPEDQEQSVSLSLVPSCMTMAQLIPILVVAHWAGTGLAHLATKVPDSLHKSDLVKVNDSKIPSS
ncbi:hypothetical protein CLAIMM_14213, partial [Cladophialophora immunda]